MQPTAQPTVQQTVQQNAQPTNPPEFLARDDNINEGIFFLLYRQKRKRYSLGLNSCSLDDNISRKRRNDNGDESSDDNNLASRIVNGIAAADNSWPWLARLAFQTQTQHDSNSNNFRIEIIYVRHVTRYSK